MNPKPTIEKDLHVILWLTNDNTGSSIDSLALKEGFRKQDRRHITILGGATLESIKEILNDFSEEKKKDFYQKLESIINNLDWKYELGGMYKIKKKGIFDEENILENRESYINMVDMSDIDIFFKKLGEVLNSDFPVQVPHITLFTKGERENPKYYGIPICSMKEFNSLSPRKLN